MSSSSLPPRNRATFTLQEIARATKGTLHNAPDATASTCSVITDTRLLENTIEKDSASTCGALFVALRGENFDGHRFLDQAFAQGATAALVENAVLTPTSQSSVTPLPNLGEGETEMREVGGEGRTRVCIEVQNTQNALGDLARFHRGRFQIPLIGVTGSYGKTTTRAFIATALAPKFARRIMATEGNYNNEIGVPLTVLALDETQHEIAVLELAMRGLGQIDYLAKIAQPTIGVITNIGPQHIELLGSLENIARAKAEILAHLPKNGTAILPANDEFFDFLKDSAPCRFVSFGSDEAADFQVANFEATQNGGRCALIHQEKRYQLNLPLPGLHNAINAACAIAVASTCGVEIEAAIESLSRVEVPGARMRLVRNLKRDLTIIDDCYNAGPDSMRAALQVLAGVPGQHRRVAVLGAMRELGAWTESEHRKLGASVIESGVEIVVGVGEETKWMLESAREIETVHCNDAGEAAQLVESLVRANDVVLVKGSRSIGLEKVVATLEHSE